MNFEISALNVNGTKKALEKRELLDQVLSRLTPEVAAVLTDPYSAKWHDGNALLAIWQAVRALRGLEAVETLNHEIVRDSLGPVLGPVLKMATLLAGASPATLFSRLDQLASAGSRGSTHTWAKESDTSGTLTIRYPSPQPLELMEAIWRGIFRVTRDLLGTPVIIDSVTEAPGHAFVFRIRW